MGRKAIEVTIRQTELDSLRKELEKERKRVEYAEAALQQIKNLNETRIRQYHTQIAELQTKIDKLENTKAVLFIEQVSVPFVPSNVIRQFEILPYMKGCNAPIIFVPQPLKN